MEVWWEFHFKAEMGAFVWTSGVYFLDYILGVFQKTKAQRIRERNIFPTVIRLPVKLWKEVCFPWNVMAGEEWTHGEGGGNPGRPLNPITFEGK